MGYTMHRLHTRSGSTGVEIILALGFVLLTIAVSPWWLIAAMLAGAVLLGAASIVQNRPTRYVSPADKAIEAGLVEPRHTIAAVGKKRI